MAIEYAKVCFDDDDLGRPFRFRQLHNCQVKYLAEFCTHNTEALLVETITLSAGMCALTKVNTFNETARSRIRVLDVCSATTAYVVGNGSASGCVSQ